MKKIPLTKGKFALVDDADFDWLNQYKWHAVSNAAGNWYASHSMRTVVSNGDVIFQPTRMHALITGARRTDHQDGDGLNNQRYNLRPASIQENNQNTRKRRDNKSGFKGVSWHKLTGKWAAYIGTSPKEHLGLFNTAEEAAQAYDQAAIKLFGKFAKLNFPEKQQTQTTN